MVKLSITLKYSIENHKCVNKEILNERRHKIPHDILIAAKAAEERRFTQLDMELAYRRRHGNNAGGEEHRIGRLLNEERLRKLMSIYPF